MNNNVSDINDVKNNITHSSVNFQQYLKSICIAFKHLNCHYEWKIQVIQTNPPVASNDNESAFQTEIHLPYLQVGEDFNCSYSNQLSEAIKSKNIWVNIKTTPMNVIVICTRND